MSGRVLLTICLISSFGCGHSIQINHHENVAYAWSHKFQKCLEMPFVISKTVVGKSGPAKEVPPEMCDNITGFKNSAEKAGWPSFKTWLLIEVFQNAEDHGFMEKNGYDRPTVTFYFDKGLTGDNK